MDRSLFFMIMALACFWLVLDEIYGRQLITQLIIKIIPKAED